MTELRFINLCRKLPDRTQAFVSDLINRPDVSINQFGRTATELCVLLGSLILTKGYDKDKCYQSFRTYVRFLLSQFVTGLNQS